METNMNEEPVGRHSRHYLWNRTSVIVLGNKDPERGGIPGTFYRMPTNLKDWDSVMKAGGPGPIRSGTEIDDEDLVKLRQSHLATKVRKVFAHR